MNANNIFLYFVIVFFVLLGFVLPHINSVSPIDTANNDVDAWVFAVQNQEGIVTVTIKTIASICTIFFWTFGGLPVWLDLIIFIPIRVMFWIVVYDKIRGIA